MHNYLQVYYFIDKFNLKELSNIKKKINIVFRNYSNNIDINEIQKTHNFCKKRGFNLYLANNIKLAIKLNLDGVYIPAFNNKLNYYNLKCNKKFKIIGSAHNLKEVRVKEKQNCEIIFISPLFKTQKSKNYLEIARFNLIAKRTKKDVICLGGIDTKNLKRVNLTKSKGIASISWIKKNGLNKNLGRF